MHTQKYYCFLYAYTHNTCQHRAGSAMVSHFSIPVCRHVFDHEYVLHIYVCVLLLQNGVTPLAIAADRGHSSVVHLLLKAEAKTDVQDKVKIQPCFSFWHATFYISSSTGIGIFVSLKHLMSMWFLQHIIWWFSHRMVILPYTMHAQGAMEM